MFHRRVYIKLKGWLKILKKEFILLNDMNMTTINLRIYSKQQKTYPNLTLSNQDGDH